jgi:NDP-sugar pyrophosphorylase family protein
VRAVVLVGGEGTRLRPLTETVPKPLLPLVDRPMLDHVLDHLVAHGVREVIMSSPYLEATFGPFLEARAGTPAISWVTEREPLGTGGAIVSVLDRLGTEPFFALNGDILTDLDLTEMLDAHRERGASVTIALHRVDDARAFGLVESDRDGRIVAFREKPPEPIGGDINAGTYVLDPRILRRWTPGTYLWIEGEVFPALIDEGVPVYGYSAGAYWLDLGTPEHYLRAHLDLLSGAVGRGSYESPWIGAEAVVDPSATVARSVVVGPRGTIGAGARIQESILLPGAVVGERGRVRRSILGPSALVGSDATVVDSVLGAGASVPPGASVTHARVSSGSVAGEETTTRPVA